MDQHVFLVHKANSDEAIEEIRMKHQDLVNQVRSLDNWIEKYEPLRTQNQISATLQNTL